jgi:hypothetical protein
MQYNLQVTLQYLLEKIMLLTKPDRRFLRITYVKLRQHEKLYWHYQGIHFYNHDLEL